MHVDRGRCSEEEVEEEEEATLGRRAAGGVRTGLMLPRKEGHSGGAASSRQARLQRSRQRHSARLERITTPALRRIAGS